MGVLGNQGACIIAKSYEMKSYGVGTGMPIWDGLNVSVTWTGRRRAAQTGRHEAA